MNGLWNAEGVRRLWNRYKYAALVMLLGVGLMVWGHGSGRSTPAPSASAESRNISREMEQILEKMNGVGQVRVMLTEESDGERRLAADSQLSYRGSASAPEEYSRSSEVVLVDSGDRDEAVVTQTRYPTYRGALIVCQGGDQPSVRLAVTQAVAALTGLPADRIAVEKWQ